MAVLSVGEEIMTIALFVLRFELPECDRQTDGRTDGHVGYTSLL